MKAVVCQTHDELESAGPGAILGWRYAEKKASSGHAGHIMQNCAGCGQAAGMMLYDEGTPKPPSPSWSVSGWPDSITLKPSIHHDTPACGWHGYLTNGEYHK